MNKNGLTLGQKWSNFGAKMAQLQKPAIRSKQSPKKCPKIHTVHCSCPSSQYSLRGRGASCAPCPAVPYSGRVRKPRFWIQQPKLCKVHLIWCSFPDGDGRRQPNRPDITPERPPDDACFLEQINTEFLDLHGHLTCSGTRRATR